MALKFIIKMSSFFLPAKGTTRDKRGRKQQKIKKVNQSIGKLTFAKTGFWPIVQPIPLDKI